MINHPTYDIAIIGSGFTGSLMAMVARRLGRSVVMVERGRHPRFAIGESSTPLANLLLEELATTYGLPRLLALAKWPTWQQAYPEVGCGLKRGFTFYHHCAGERFEKRDDRSNQLLVAASPGDHVADTHWFRSDFDAFLVHEAQSIGVTYHDEVELRSIHFQSDAASIEATRRGERLNLSARWVIDASGANGFLSRQLGHESRPICGFPATQSLYTHFRGVGDCEKIIHREGDLFPFPPDAAAVHHVFDGGWIWSLRFNNGVTSAGIMATESLAGEMRLAEGEPAWRRVLQRFPTIREVFANAQPIQSFIHAPKIAFLAPKITGPGWTLLPSAAGFVDPLLSTGFPLALLGIHRLGKIIALDWGTERWAGQLNQYAAQTSGELDATARLVSSLYGAMSNFDRFVPLSLLYFAAASYSEVARRLHRPELAGSFLMHDHPDFGPAMRRCCDLSDTQSLKEEVMKAIAPIDIAGLCRSDHANWYPVDPSDTLAAAHKLGVDDDAIRQMFTRCGVCYASS